MEEKSLSFKGISYGSLLGKPIDRPEGFAYAKGLLCWRANLESGALFILHRLACPIPLTAVRFDHRILNGLPPSLCRSRPSPDLTTHTLPSGLGILHYLQAATYSRLPGG